jgi:hypothetical protein
MRKYAQGEGDLEVLRGEEAVIVQSHLQRTGKSVTEFDDKERSALHDDLDRVREDIPPDPPSPEKK